MKTANENMNRKPPVIIRNARPIFRNFAGTIDEYNKEGRRSFSVVVTPEIRDALIAAGFEVKTHTVKKTGDTFEYFPVKIGNRMPTLFITEYGECRREMDAETWFDTLDACDIESVTFSVTPYDCVVMGKSYRVGYVKTLSIVLGSDDLAHELDGNE